MTKLNKDGLLVQLRDFGIGPIVGMFISMMTVPITTRLVAPEEFGKSSLFTLMQTIFNLIALLGIDQSFVRFYNQKDINRKNLLFNSVLLPSTLCFSIIIVVLLFRKRISIFMFGQYEPLIMFSFIFFLPALLLNRFALLSIRMDLRGRTYSFLNIIMQVVYFIILIILLFFYEKTFRSIVFATIISTILSSIIAIIASKKYFLFSKAEVYVDKPLIKQLLKFGLPLVPAYILTWVMNSFDKISLRTWSTFSELGLYAAAFKIVSILAVLQNIFSTAWMPIAYKWYEEKVPAKKYEDVSTTILAIGSVLFSLIVVFRNVIFLFLGPEYRNTANIFVFLLFMPVMNTVSETTGLGIGFSKKTIYTLYISGIAAILNIIGNYFLVPRYGAVGAAISTCVCYISYFFARTLFSRKFWIKLHLDKYIINIILLVLFGIDILLYRNTIFEIVVLLIDILYNGFLILKIYKIR